MIRVKPWRGRWCSRKTANRINDMFDFCPKADRTAMHKEAMAFEKEMLALREKTLSKGEKW